MLPVQVRDLPYVVSEVEIWTMFLFFLFAIVCFHEGTTHEAKNTYKEED